jgi:hypothetical protein
MLRLSHNNVIVGLPPKKLKAPTSNNHDSHNGIVCYHGPTIVFFLRTLSWYVKSSSSLSSLLCVHCLFTLLTTFRFCSSWLVGYHCHHHDMLFFSHLLVLFLFCKFLNQPRIFRGLVFFSNVSFILVLFFVFVYLII